MGGFVLVMEFAEDREDFTGLGGKAVGSAEGDFLEAWRELLRPFIQEGSDDNYFRA